MSFKLIFLTLLAAACVAADPVTVQYQEGTLHGFLSLRSLDGKLLAIGDLTQVAHADRITSRIVFRFKDGSLDDETSVFTDHGVFHLISDHHIQKGSSFPQPIDMYIDAAGNKVTVHYQEKGKTRVAEQSMDLPSDLANGVILDIMKNLPTSAGETKLSWIAATPKPRLVKLAISPVGQPSFSIAGTSRKSTRFLIKIELGGLTGLIAPLIGKQPSDLNVWISDDDVPAFVKFEGAEYPQGPIWRIELASPVWPNQ